MEPADVLIVIPTVGDGDTLLPAVERIIQHTDGYRVRVMLSFNPPVDQLEEAEAVRAKAEELLQAASGVEGGVVWNDQPLGFGAANNRGLMAAVVGWGELPPLTIFMNDDARPTAGWLDHQIRAIGSDLIHGYSEPWDPRDPTSKRTDRDRSLYGRCGIVGPTSNLVAGIQQVRYAIGVDGAEYRFDDVGIDRFAAVVGQRYDAQYLTCDFISGFCVGLTRECIEDLMLVTEGGELRGAKWADEVHEPVTNGTTDDVLAREGTHYVGIWDEDTFRVGGFEDNDLCIRAEMAGWRTVVANAAFVGHIGHQTLDRLFPDSQRGLANRIPFMQKWDWYTNPDRDLRLIATYRLKFECINDINMLRNSILAAARVVDGFAVVLTNSPLDIQDHESWHREREGLPAPDLEMLKACDKLGPEDLCEVIRAWMSTVASNEPMGRWTRDPKAGLDQILVRPWLGDTMDERAERNMTHELAEEMGADWLLSLDHDENVENRIDRSHFERWMRVPDPGVRSWDQAWMNHWDSARLCREDMPWGDGGTYTGGMHGFRLWRIPRNADGEVITPRRIIGGHPPHNLHCGNAPNHDIMAKRVSGLRFRHFGYAKASDRFRKYARYKRQDPNASPLLTGNDSGDAYGHLVAEEGMRLSPFNPRNGIGLFMLMHRGETAGDLARTLDQVYGLVDRIVLVWTDDWADEDRVWLDNPSLEDQAEVEHAAKARAAWLAQMEEQGLEYHDREGPPRLRAAQKALDKVKTWEPDEWVSTGPGLDVAQIAAFYGAEWVQEDFDMDLAKARNAGLEALWCRSYKRGIWWSLFLDLDELFPQGGFGEVVAMRRMAEVTDSHGFLFEFRNFHQHIAPSTSESIRFCRLDPSLYFSSRVHESYELAFSRAQAQGRQVKIRKAPFEMHHYGLGKTDAEMRKKLQKYQQMLLLELEEQPHNAGAWVALALHLQNDGREDQAKQCLEQAVICAGPGYLPYRELGFYYARIARAFLAEAVSRSGPGMQFYKAGRQLVEFMGKAVPDQPVIGRGPNHDGPPTCPPIQLPEFTMPETGIGGLPITLEAAEGQDGDETEG